jgi:hypothetical protein
MAGRMLDTGCAIRDAGYGMRDTRCGIRDKVQILFNNCITF